MNEHASLVSYPWLIGTAIAMFVIIIPMVYTFGRGKVNKEMCKLMHDNTDKIIGLIHSTLISQASLLQETHDSVVRVEVWLGKNGIGK